MTLSTCAEKLGISYKTAWRWWKEGKLDAYQTETGIVIVREPIEAPAGIALYARVSSADQKDDLARQLERLQTYAMAKGDTVSRIGTERLPLHRNHPGVRWRHPAAAHRRRASEGA